MKSITLTTPTGITLLVQEVNSDAYDFVSIGSDTGATVSYCSKQGGSGIFHVPFEKSEILGVCDKNGCDFSPADLVQKMQVSISLSGGITEKSLGGMYMDYLKSNDKERHYTFQFATDSFLSLLASNGFKFTNRFSEKSPENKYNTRFKKIDRFAHGLDIKQWEQEQKQVVGKVVIIRVNK